MERLSLSADRRRFWERFAALAFAAPDRKPQEMDLAAAMGRQSPSGGSVALVGAGPGDPELLTLRAMRALRSADIILYDDLVSPEILAFARREARTMLVGKTGHRASCRQEDINSLMVRLAREGRRVVRRKGGDPLIFGRAGEEIAACAAQGVPVEIVPGITALQCAAARLCRSLTSRGVVRRVQLVTGHDERGALPADMNWSAIADRDATTAIYMPRRTLRGFLSQLLERGLADLTAIAVIAATRADERIIVATVSTLADAADDAPEGPMLLLVGKALAEDLDRPARHQRAS